jgi:sterol desaturase/sphingolipid hydroxylase (fatty acid hydroxylase superfamily)
MTTSLADDLARARQGRRTGPAAAAVRHLGYPVLLLAVLVVPLVTVSQHWDYGQASMFFLLGTVAYLAALELLLPYEPSWRPTPSEWRTYGVYFLLSMAGGALAQLPTWAVLQALTRPHAMLPLWAEIPTALLVGSLASYLVHRVSHQNRWLWRLHGIHHAPEKVNVANNGVNHVADVFVSQAAVQLSLALAGFSDTAVFVVGIFVIAQGYFVHANVDVELGRLTYVLAGPEVHRLHHSTYLPEAGHYGSDLVIWDLLFGSFTWQPGRRPEAVGLSDPSSFPPTSAVIASLVSPVRRRRSDPAARPTP